MYMYVYIDRLIINETNIESTIRRMKRKEEKKSTFEHAQKYDLSIDSVLISFFRLSHNRDILVSRETWKELIGISIGTVIK